MYLDFDVTPEEEDEMIRNIAKRIHKYGFGVPAIFMIQSIQPLSYIGAQMGRLFVSPFLPILGENIGISGEKFLQIFEKHENVEKLIKTVEELTREEEDQKKTEKAKKLEEKRTETETGEMHNKKWWQRFLP